MRPAGCSNQRRPNLVDGEWQGERTLRVFLKLSRTFPFRSSIQPMDTGQFASADASSTRINLIPAGIRDARIRHKQNTIVHMNWRSKEIPICRRRNIRWTAPSIAAKVGALSAATHTKLFRCKTSTDNQDRKRVTTDEGLFPHGGCDRSCKSIAGARGPCIGADECAEIEGLQRRRKRSLQ